MRGIIRLIVMGLLGLTAACGRERNIARMQNWQQENGKLKVLTTIAMIHDLVAQIGGDHIDSLALIYGELDPHSYELVKGDDEKFARADLIFYNGLGLEHGASLRAQLEKNPRARAVGDPIFQKHPEKILIVDGQVDPHIWMDIALWMQAIDPIVDALCEKDPIHADDYRNRGEKLFQEMKEADLEAFTTLHAIPEEKRYLVTSHDAFNYFTRHYLAATGEQNWERRCEAPEGLAPDAQLSVTDIQAIIDYVERFKVSVLFPEANVSQDALRKILHAGKKKGCALRLCQETLHGDTMGNETSYLSMMKHNVHVIARELVQ